jgi:membrane protein required for beta-lactamase induction
MENDDGARIVKLLEQIRDNQAAQLEIAQRLAERTERIQDRAEDLQARGMGIMKTARRSLAIVLPVVILLIIYLSWLLFR